MELDDEIAMMERQVDEMREKEQAAGGGSQWTSAEDVQQALDAQKNNHRFAKDTDDRSIFITNLPKGEEGGYVTTHEDLCKFFEDCGRIATCTILRDRKTQELKGSAYVEFATYEGHGKAMDTKQNAIFHGRPLKVYRTLPDDGPDGGTVAGYSLGGWWRSPRRRFLKLIPHRLAVATLPKWLEGGSLRCGVLCVMVIWSWFVDSKPPTHA
jgi:RNA recognition motif-containing protein